MAGQESVPHADVMEALEARVHRLTMEAVVLEARIAVRDRELAELRDRSAATSPSS